MTVTAGIRGEADMDHLPAQLVWGGANLILGFTFGWLCKAITGASRSNAAKGDVTLIFEVMDDVESSSQRQARSWATLRKQLVAGSDAAALEPHRYTNDCYASLLKATQNQLTRLDPGARLVPASFIEELTENRISVAQLTEELHEDRLNTGGGNAAGVLRRLTALETANERLSSRLAEARQVIAQQAAELQLTRSAALEDLLTKLPNRRAFEQRFKDLNAAYQRHRRPFCLLLIDLDDFKRVNDRYGHSAGDKVLSATAGTLRAACRESDLVCRYGGEEFAILAADTKLDAGAILAERIRRQVSLVSVSDPGGPVRCTCSIGVAEAGIGCVGPRLLRKADELLYAAKAAGRNCVRGPQGSEAAVLRPGVGSIPDAGHLMAGREVS